VFGPLWRALSDIADLNDSLQAHNVLFFESTVCLCLIWSLFCVGGVVDASRFDRQHRRRQRSQSTQVRSVLSLVGHPEVTIRVCCCSFLV
jgi:hypothetical protein